MSHYLAIAAEYPHTVFGIYDTLDEAQQDIDARIAIPKAKRPVRDEDIARLQSPNSGSCVHLLFVIQLNPQQSHIADP